VLSRPDDYFGQEEFSVKPGLHRAQAGEHDVVWWDPGALRLEVAGNFGLRQEEILAEGGPDDGLARYREWSDARDHATGEGQRMEFDLITPSTAAGAPPGFECRVEIDQSLARSGPSGARFGTLVHQVLRDVDFARAGADAEALARMHGRLLGATSEEVAAAAVAAQAVVQHPMIRRAQQAERCHREYPVMLRLEGNQMLEGVIDLAFLEKDGWTVVDFKSDTDLASHRAEYEKQLQWYGAALARITGRPVRGCILGV